MASESVVNRREAIAVAIADELRRQGVSGVDVDALTQTIETALSAGAPVSEGRHPDELNATNDD